MIFDRTSIWSTIYHSQLTDLLEYTGQKFCQICEICVLEISYLKTGQKLENKTSFFKAFCGI